MTTGWRISQEQFLT